MKKMFNLEVIKHNTYNVIKTRFFGISFKFKLNKKTTQKNKIEYIDFIFNKDTSNFVPLTKEKYNQKSSIKPIAFYLPQFHTIPLNDEKVEKGFCEWTNVTKTIPYFTGHYQPHLPVDVGFYDLTSDKVMYRQIELAKLYGIYGFCFHYYWFSGGKRLLETPLFNYLNNKELDLPFCLCWANESWKSQWDGGNKEVLMEQKFTFDDPERFFYDTLAFFKDERYIKIDNKPVLVYYNPKLFKKDETIYFVNKLQELAKKEGFNGLYIIGALVFENKNSTEFNMDASVEFFPNNHENIKEKDMGDTYINNDYKCIIYDMEDAVKNKKFMPNYNHKVFKGIFPSWDNSARKALQGGWCFQSSPKLYKAWLKDIINYTKEYFEPAERYIFINAWNEWAEGAHLEPDRKYGYAYLEATKEALEEESASV